MRMNKKKKNPIKQGLLHSIPPNLFMTFDLSCPFPKVHHVHVSALTTCALYHCPLDFSDKLQRRSSHAINRHPTKSPMPCIVKRQSGLDMLGGTSGRSTTSSIALHPLPLLMRTRVRVGERRRLTNKIRPWVDGLKVYCGVHLSKRRVSQASISLWYRR